jgi:hypothetical protein
MSEPRKFAEGTEISAERSRADIETLLRKHGASEFAVYTSDERTVYMYRLKGMMVRHQVEYPAAKSFQKYNHLKTPLLTKEKLEKAAESEWRRRWRALLLVCKAKLEMIDSGGSTFEREFLADILLANGETMGQVMLPRVEEMYRTGGMPDFPRLLLGPGKETP